MPHTDVEDPMKPQPAPVRRTNKTPDDFLRWLRQRTADRERAAEEQTNQTDRARMVWGDDGGKVTPDSREGEAPAGG